MEKDKRPENRAPLWMIFALDAALIALGLCLFALFHHVIPAWYPERVEPLPVVTAAPTPGPQPGAGAAEERPSPASAPAPTALPPRSGTWGETFREQFTDGEVIRTENSYRSGHISVQIRTEQQDGLTYHVAEIYVSDLKYLRSALGGDTWAQSAFADDQARAHGAVVAISGDHYYGRLEGIVIRNGLLYRDSRFEDLCVLLRDGRMLTFPDEELDLDALLEQAPWQVWSFGPRLLENGKAREEIPSTVAVPNPRSAIGYVEPGHYFFVQVEGRSALGSRGMTLKELAALFEELGCETAYNLDGGRSASMVWMGELYSCPYDRKVYDIIYVCDGEEDSP